MSSVRKFNPDYLINWYVGNFIKIPNNEIRDESFDVEKDNWKPIWFDDIENIRKELSGSSMTHADFMKLMKEKGIHIKYYKYKQYQNNCKACNALNIKGWN